MNYRSHTLTLFQVSIQTQPPYSCYYWSKMRLNLNCDVFRFLLLKNFAPFWLEKDQSCFSLRAEDRAFKGRILYLKYLVVIGTLIKFCWWWVGLAMIFTDFWVLRFVCERPSMILHILNERIYWSWIFQSWKSFKLSKLIRTSSISLTVGGVATQNWTGSFLSFNS